jgi:iron complex outermembrane receptor protein
MKTGELKATVSKGFRNPTTKEMYMYGSANHETLHAESMVNYELAWSGRLIGSALTYGVNIFLVDGDNMIQTVDNRNINTGTFHNRGVEAEAAYRLGHHL